MKLTATSLLVLILSAPGIAMQTPASYQSTEVERELLSGFPPSQQIAPTQQSQVNLQLSLNQIDRLEKRLTKQKKAFKKQSQEVTDHLIYAATFGALYALLRYGVGELHYSGKDGSPTLGGVIAKGLPTQIERTILPYRYLDKSELGYGIFLGSTYVGVSLANASALGCEAGVVINLAQAIRKASGLAGMRKETTKTIDKKNEIYRAFNYSPEKDEEEYSNPLLRSFGTVITGVNKLGKLRLTIGT